MDDPATSRGQLRRRSPPRTPALGPEPRRKSAAVHRGNPALPEVSAQPGTICPGALTQEQRCQGGFPLTCCTHQAIWSRPADRSITTADWTWWRGAGCTSTVHHISVSREWEH
ncbi:hypothetical protein KUCAC02_013882 [Chaenocephalus aceratus]|uniref:Uncharacterized protein n=1 Tax=Chaenocephalus aceratus TaxID=36190 RepID=A0ACB9WC58_CHAAC|nr:hypothetical protein KUCAC02_013882 [Chaenocephalus aceratus]